MFLQASEELGFRVKFIKYITAGNELESYRGTKLTSEVRRRGLYGYDGSLWIKSPIVRGFVLAESLGCSH